MLMDGRAKTDRQAHDMTLGPHLWQFSRLGKVGVIVEFHTPVDLKDAGSRKDLTRYCLTAVAGGVERALTGRALVPDPGALSGH